MYTTNVSTQAFKYNRYTALLTQITKTVDLTIITAAQSKLVVEKKINFQALVKATKEYISLTDSISKTNALLRYQEMLRKAQHGGIKPEKWYAEWNKAYLHAKSLDLKEIEGVVVSKCRVRYTLTSNYKY